MDPPKFNSSLSSNTHYSVVILIIDALSQQNFLRSLPRTKTYLDDQGGILFRGHHKVGHNSYPNVMGLLSGELGGQFPPPHDTGVYYIDKERQLLMPSVYKQHNYTTMFMEDLNVYATFTRPGQIGFSEPPVDVYYREAFKMKFDKHIENTLVGKADCYACIQEQMIHVQQFRVIHDFLTTYSDQPTFQHIHMNEYSHNVLNMAKLYDHDLLEMMKQLIESRALENKFFFILGDHGFQRGEEPFIFTKQGTIEDNMPAAYLLPPVNFNKSHGRLHANLMKNSQKLTSHWDINQMMRELLSMSVQKTVYELFPQYEGHGGSLLDDLGDRDCSSAGISDGICQCEGNVATLPEPHSSTWTRAIIQDVNTFLSPYDYCQQLIFHKVRVSNYRLNHEMLMVKIQFEVGESRNIFEGTFSWSFTSDEFLDNTLVRLDWYSSTSKCVPSGLEFLRPYCIC